MPKRPSEDLSDLLARPPVAERRLFLVGLITALGFFAVLAWPMLLGKLYVSDDLGNQHIPMRHFYSQALAHGHNFTWNPDIYCGYFLHGEGQVGMYHPLHLVLYRFLPFAEAFNIELFMSYPLILIGTYLFLRRWRLRKDSALFGALIFTLSGFNLLHLIHMQAVAIVAHLPWLLLAIDIYVRESGRRRATAGLLVAALTASQLLLGHPQIFWFSSFVEFLYVILLGPLKVGLRTLVGLAAFKFAGILAGGIQLAATFEAFLGCERHAAAGYRSDQMSLPPANFLQLIGPYLFGERVLPGQPPSNVHEYGIYNGAVSFMLFGWLVAAIGRLRANRRLATGAIVLTVLGFLLALGRYAGLYTIVSKLPPLSWFRAPCRYILFAHLGMAVAAALAYDRMRNREAPSQRGRGGILFFLAFPVIALSVALFVKLSVFTDTASDGGLVLAAGPLLFAVAAAALIAALRGFKPAFALLFVFVAVDQGYYGLSYIYREPPVHLMTLAGTVRVPDYPESMRIEAYPALDNIATLSGRKLVTGYIGLNPVKALDYTEQTPLRLASAAWRFVKTEETMPGGALMAGLDVQSIPSAMPRVRLVSDAVVNDDVVAALDEIDIATTAIVTKELGLAGGPRGKATIMADLPGDITVSVESPSRQLLVVSESFHEGWRATVNGSEAQVLRVYGDFMGCVVEGGAHEVHFIFQAKSLAIGALISIGGVVLSLLMFVVVFFITRGERARSPAP